MSNGIPELRALYGYPDYAASADGRIWRVVRPKGGRYRNRPVPYALAPGRQPSGYLFVNLNGPVSLHKLILETFMGPRPTPDHQVAHNNGNKRDNRVENLRWATAKENQADRWRHGTEAAGEKSSSAKLTIEQAQLIKRHAFKYGDVSRLARELGVSRRCINHIRSGDSWSHFDESGHTSQQAWGECPSL